MGAYQCKNSCMLRVKDNDLVKEDKVMTKAVVSVQSFYRGHAYRRQFKKNIAKYIKYKKKKYLNTENQMLFKENWEFFFKFKQQYDFSLIGIKNLSSDLHSFYSDFFKGVMNRKLILSTKRTLQNITKKMTYKKDSIIENEDIEEENKHLTVFNVDMIKKINSAKEFTVLFKIYFLGTLSEMFDIGTLGLSLSELKFEFSSVKPGNEVIRTIKFEKNEGEQKEKLIDHNEPYIDILLNEIDTFEKNYCSISSFQDRNNVHYLGAVKDNTLTKWGLGKEYYIDPQTKYKDNKEIEDFRFKHCGYFQNGLYHGLGMHIKETGECYYGEYRNGLKHGYGILYSNDFSYRGFFYKDKFEGYGEYSKHHFFYCGNFVNGLFEGFGYMETDNNSVCIGNFKNGKVNSEACYKWSSGQIYYGSWRDGKMDGYGEFIWKNGDRYVGYYENDLRHGKGEYYFNNGAVLKGTWVKGQKEGQFNLKVLEENTYMNMKKGNYVIKYSKDIQMK